MDFSLKTYIERVSTERLEEFLKQYYNGEFTEDFTYVVPYIEYVLDRRKDNLKQ